MEPEDITSIAQAHRKMRDTFINDPSIEAINNKINQDASLTDKKIALSVELVTKNAWENSLVTQLDEIPFHYMGKGEQCVVKTELALAKRTSQNASIILLEEPENHLSHTRLNQLIKCISEQYAEKQILISTHSSFVANKLGLGKVMLLDNLRITKFSELSEDTYNFFKKVAGYDTLRMILCKKAILCEGDSDELVIQKAYMQLNDGRLPIEDGIEVISVGVSFLRFDGLDSQKKICNYASSVLELELEMHEVKAISEKLLHEALKYTITMVADSISEYSTVVGLAEHLDTSKEEAAMYLTNFIEFVVEQGWDNLINKVTKPILPNQNGNFTIKEKIFLDNEMDETLKEIACIAGYDIREELLMKEIYLELPENRQKTNKDIAGYITEFVQDNRNTKEPEIRNAFHKLLLWVKDHQSEAENILPILYANKHYLYDDDDIANNIRQAETFTNIMSKYDIDSPEQLEAIIMQGTKGAVVDTALSKEAVTEEVLLQYGIDSQEALDMAFSNSEFASQFIRESRHEISTYEYVKKILERAQKNVLSFLDEQEEYDLSDIQKIADTIFVVKKNGKQIYVLARPSDGGEVRIYYRTEMDILDYSMDWELWVEDGKKEPQKITFGKIIKLTGLNRIPLKGM